MNNPSEEFEVEEILARRQRQETEYLIKWKNFPITESTWEPLSNLSAVEEMIVQYNDAHPNPTLPSSLKNDSTSRPKNSLIEIYENPSESHSNISYHNSERIASPNEESIICSVSNDKPNFEIDLTIADYDQSPNSETEVIAINSIDIPVPNENSKESCLPPSAKTSEKSQEKSAKEKDPLIIPFQPTIITGHIILDGRIFFDFEIDTDPSIEKKTLYSYEQVEQYFPELIIEYMNKVL